MQSEGVRTTQIISLLDEIDFRDVKDQQKIYYLKEEISNCFKQNNCVNQLCISFEGGRRQELNQKGGLGLEHYISNICNILGFSSGEWVALAFCLVQSKYAVFASESFRILKLKLPEIQSVENLKGVGEVIWIGLSQYIRASEVKYTVAY